MTSRLFSRMKLQRAFLTIVKSLIQEVISLVGLGGVSDTILQVASTDGYFLA